MVYIRKFSFSSGAVKSFTSLTVASNMKTVASLFFKHLRSFENNTSVLCLDSVYN